MNKILNCAMIFSFSTMQPLACEAAVFYPEDSVQVRIVPKQTSVAYFVYSNSAEIRKDISFDTEKALKIEIDDYNFDGYKDIAVSHIDDGMGSFAVYRVFLYSADSKDFEETMPSCGDQFLNLQIDKKRKVLVSTYYEENVPVLCEAYSRE